MEKYLLAYLCERKIQAAVNACVYIYIIAATECAADKHETALGSAHGQRHALWLPIDATTVDDATILPLVLREPWNQNVPIFSSSFSHVDKGVLFSLYPNNAELGRSLGALATALLTGATNVRGVTPLRTVCAAQHPNREPLGHGARLATATCFSLSLSTALNQAGCRVL